MRKRLLSVVGSAALSCSVGIFMASCAGSHEAMPYTPAEQTNVDRADPQMRAVLDELHNLNPRPYSMLTAAEARQQPTPADAVKKLLAEKKMSTDPEPVGGISSMTATGGPLGDIPLRVYMPQGNGPFPALVYFHGGGWVIGSLDAYDSSCRALTNMAHCVVVSVDYRQAPEHKFPGPTEDAYAATQYVMSHAADFHVDAKHVTVGGESAGGNLAAVVCMMARDRGGMMPSYQLLIYPVTDYAFDTDSYRENANAFPLDRASMTWFFDKYLTTSAEGVNPYISILRGDVSKLPPATVITAEIDPLRSDGKAYAEKLKAGGVPVKYMEYKGVTHEFFGMGAVVDTAKRAEHFAAEGLQSSFAQ